ncbi:cancer-associated gene 1 protein isoform X4 [Castor canadensis]|uniref:Cancer-associated gene 1 protein isoform X4 n=1 Tax=Castor canadensis TaxID=51338 RepID=A0AC58NBM7_CASCN
MERPSIIQLLGLKTLKTFGHHPCQRKKRKKFWSSSSHPVRFEMDTSYEKLESMSESDAMNVSGLSQDFYHLDSSLCIEVSHITSDLPQNETKNLKRENGSTPSLSEDIYSIQDNVLGDTNIGDYSQNVQIQPINTSISSLRQFEPICKFHWIEAFGDEMTTFQNLVEDVSCPEKSELQNHGCNYAKETNIMQDSFKEENAIETITSTNKDQLAHECVRQSPRSPSLTYCNGETLQFTENSLDKNPLLESALKPTQPQSILDKESIPRNVENASYSENSFALLDLRVNYKTEAIEVSSKEIQNSREIPQMSVNHQEEVIEEGVESLEIASTWSPAAVSRSRGTSQNCMLPDMGQSLESLPLEEDMALNEVLQKLKHTNRKQQMQIQDLQCRNVHLEKKIKELQVKITKKHVFVDIINKLKENIEELIEDKYNIILEKNGINKKLQNLQEILANAHKHHQESRKEKETLQIQLKKLKVNCIRLQERYITEMQQKTISVNQCIEMDKTLCKKEEEIERLQQLKEELETATTSALDLLKREKEAREQEFLSLQEEFQKHEKENLKERRKLKSKVEKLIAQVKNLLLTCENERAKNTKLQQQIDEVKNENAELQHQHQVVRNEEQNCVPKFEISQFKEQLEEVMEPYVTKGTKRMHSNLLLNCSPCEENSLSPPAVKKTQLTSRIQSLLALVVGLLTCQLLKHKDRITMLRELIANEKAFQDHMFEVTDFDSNEAKNVRDVPVLLAAKLDKYHNLNEELDFLITKLGSLLESKEDHCQRLIEENDKYQRHVGSLINKVTSYEEIIKCADQRLEISHSQIAYLEERNKHLEDLIRTPREKARKPRLSQNECASLSTWLKEQSLNQFFQ